MSVASTVIVLNGAQLVNSESFHDAFATAFGFPDFYGRNMHAWIDCMSYLDEPEAGMSKVTVQPGQVVTLRIDDYSRLKEEAAKQWLYLLEATAFVNWRRTEEGRGAILALAFYG